MNCLVGNCGRQWETANLYNVVFALGCLCKCMLNKSRLAAILFLCCSKFTLFWCKYLASFSREDTQVPSLQHTNWHVDCTFQSVITVTTTMSSSSSSSSSSSTV